MSSLTGSIKVESAVRFTIIKIDTKAKTVTVRGTIGDRDFKFVMDEHDSFVGNLDIKLRT